MPDLVGLGSEFRLQPARCLECGSLLPLYRVGLKCNFLQSLATGLLTRAWR